MIVAQGSAIFPAARLEALREEIVFEAPEAPEAPPSPMEEVGALDFSALPSPILIGIGVLLLAALGCLCYLLVQGWRRSAGKVPVKNVDLQYTTIDEEALVREGVDPELLIHAEEAGQLDLAIRLHYLRVLQQLNERGLIRYRKDLSNRDYLGQLRQHPVHKEISQVTQDYERYWYGQYPLDSLTYRLVRSRFDRISETLTAPPSATAVR